MTHNLDALWDFNDPALSEQRFRDAMTDATADDKLILQTQIARTFGLRGDFAAARELLSTLEAQQAAASPELQARYHLELGRAYASAAHPADQLTPDATEAARRHFQRAYTIAAGARLDYLAIDALHMMPFVDTDPDQQLQWNEQAIAYLERSDQPDAKRWEGSLRNNLGYALHQQGDYEAALRQFRLSRAAHERAGKETAVRIADWMIAWTLRAQLKYDAALAIQLELERAWDADGRPDPYVYEELQHLYRALGDESRANHYAQKLRRD